MDNAKTELAELVCTRISHDLIGNIGAFNNIMEILSENNCAIEQDDFNVLATAASTLSARQQFFRIAFGQETTALAPAKLQQICRDYLAVAGNRAYALDFECNNMAPEMAKILCLCLMIGAEVCLRGGHIKVQVGRQVVVETTSQTALSAPKISVYQQILEGKNPAENTAQFVQLIYLQELLGANVPMKLSTAENKMTLIIG